MKFETLGEKKNPAILMIHGMFCDSKACMPFSRLLQDDYYVILPTLDAHYKNSGRLISAKQQARKIVRYLHKEKISSLALLQGTSMGAEVALAVAANCDLPIAHCFFDGGPFFQFPKLVKFFMFKKFQSLAKKCKGKPIEEIMKDKSLRRLGGGDVEQYRALLEHAAEMAEDLKKEDIKAMVEICYNCKLPSFSKKMQKKFIFFFSQGEPAHMSKNRLLKKYPASIYIDWPGNSHCGFQTSDPAAYSAYIRKWIEG